MEVFGKIGSIRVGFLPLGPVKMSTRLLHVVKTPPRTSPSANTIGPTDQHAYVQSHDSQHAKYTPLPVIKTENAVDESEDDCLTFFVLVY